MDKKWLRLILQGLSNSDLSFFIFLLLFSCPKLEGKRGGEVVGLLGRREMNCQTKKDFFFLFTTAKKTPNNPRMQTQTVRNKRNSEIVSSWWLPGEKQEEIELLGRKASSTLMSTRLCTLKVRRAMGEQCLIRDWTSSASLSMSCRMRPIQFWVFGVSPCMEEANCAERLWGVLWAGSCVWKQLLCMWRQMGACTCM